MNYVSLHVYSIFVPLINANFVNNSSCLPACLLEQNCASSFHQRGKRSQNTCANEKKNLLSLFLLSPVSVYNKNFFMFHAIKKEFFVFDKTFSLFCLSALFPCHQKRKPSLSTKHLGDDRYGRRARS